MELERGNISGSQNLKCYVSVLTWLSTVTGKRRISSLENTASNLRRGGQVLPAQIVRLGEIDKSLFEYLRQSTII